MPQMLKFVSTTHGDLQDRRGGGAARDQCRQRAPAGGQRVVEGRQLARFMAASPEQKPETTVGRSARNHFPGIVTRVVKDRVAAQVEIQAGPHRLVALITREAADELALAPGVRAVAVVKATNVIVELPRR